MKKDALKRRLELVRSTVRTLSNDQLETVKGGEVAIEDVLDILLNPSQALVDYAAYYANYVFDCSARYTA
jgi:hypothetical protein